MPPNSEIEKLERRWRDNPKGTVFAPYAEVLRKNGDHALARDVLKQGLELHPDHIPGNIVLGRCCLDLGEDGPAETAFAHVLELDPENVIALKALADITERQGRLAEADNWLTRLVSVDPSNDEARDQFARVNAAREAAAAALTSEIIAVAPAQVSASAAQPIRTAEVKVDDLVARDRQEARDRTEASSGTIDDVGDVAAFADEALDSFLSDAPPPHGRVVPEAEVTMVTPAFTPPPPALAPLAGLETAELKLEAPTELEPLVDLRVDEPFTPPPSAEPARSTGAFERPGEGPPVIELTPSGSGEFQSPDDSTALLDLKPGKSEFQVPDASTDLAFSGSSASEFQTPDASEELRVSGKGSSEYQTPSGAEELLKSARAETPPEEPAPPPAPSWASTEVSGTLASLAAMPTEEMPTEPPPEEPSVAEPAAAEPPSWLFEEEETAAAPPPPSDLPLIQPEPEPEPAAPEPEPEPEPIVAEVETVTEVGSGVIESRSSAELKLIFPDDAAKPEPHRVRRITQADLAPPEEPAEPAVGEPEPVMTETMAELYARQGHTADALKVYRTLAAQQPGDPRLRERIRELEARSASAARRHTYVAADTGGESVESFFRSLAEARPGSGPAPASFQMPADPGDDNGGAPTRPARDPLSLSAIFGEEPAAQAPSRKPEPPQAPAGAPSGPDAFSFDQFFGSPPSSSSSGPSRPSGGSEEDLDQFQNWLKSLKR